MSHLVLFPGTTLQLLESATSATAAITDSFEVGVPGFYIFTATKVGTFSALTFVLQAHNETLRWSTLATWDASSSETFDIYLATDGGRFNYRLLCTAFAGGTSVSLAGAGAIQANYDSTTGMSTVATLPAKATTSAPSFTEGQLGHLSMDLSGGIRTTGGSSGGGGVAQTQVRNASNAWTDVGYSSGNLNVPVQGEVSVNNLLQVTLDGSGNLPTVVNNTITSKLQDGAGNAITSDARGSARPLAVEIVDASGAQITNFGGSAGLTDTQLRATPVPVSGTVTASGPLTDTQLRASAVPVSLASVPTHGVTGTFWQTTQPISIASMPTTPVTGTFWQATQPVSGTFWQTTQPVSIASMPTTPVTGTFWQTTQPVSIASMPSTPVTGTFWQTTQPVSLASLPALTTGSNVIGAVTQSGTWNVGTVTTLPALPAGTNTIGNVGVVPIASGGVSISRLISASGTNATVAKASAGQVYGWSFYNTNAAARYIKLYNKATAPTVGTDTPVLTLLVPGNAAGAGNNFEMTAGIPFATGIGFGTTTGMADSDTGAVGANEVIVNLFYK